MRLGQLNYETPSRSPWERPSAKLRFAGTNVLNPFRLMQTLPMRSGASRNCVSKQSLDTRKSAAKIRMTPAKLPLTDPRGTLLKLNDE
jgi:hypothetical protein